MSLRLITLVYLWDSFIFTKSYVYVSSYYGNFQYPVLFKSSARLWVWNYVQPRICLLLGHNDTGDTYILYTCLKLHGIWYVLSSVDSISVVAPHQLPAFLPLPPLLSLSLPPPPVPLFPFPKLKMTRNEATKVKYKKFKPTNAQVESLLKTCSHLDSSLYTDVMIYSIQTGNDFINGSIIDLR